MRPQPAVQGALILLAQMTEYPSEVLRTLDDGARSALLQELAALTAQAAAIRDDADLLRVVDAIHLLVAERAELRGLLLPAAASAADEQPQRAVTLADQEATAEAGGSAEQWAPQVCAALVDCRAQIQATLAR